MAAAVTAAAGGRRSSRPPSARARRQPPPASQKRRRLQPMPPWINSWIQLSLRTAVAVTALRTDERWQTGLQ